MELTVRQKLGGPTHRVLLRFHKFRTTTDTTNDKLTITIFAMKNLPAKKALDTTDVSVIVTFVHCHKRRNRCSQLARSTYTAAKIIY